eukprot:2029790-Rhodomonas_salina.4
MTLYARTVPGIAQDLEHYARPVPGIAYTGHRVARTACARTVGSYLNVHLRYRHAHGGLVAW